MPLSRLGRESWQLENDVLAALRAKIVGDRKTLGECYGPPLYGIKTGLNEAFVIDRAQRDAVVAADPKSAELLKPFLRGEDIKRWRVESKDLYLINTPRGAVDIEAYPAIRDLLAPFRERLEARATKQEWWELQQPQVAYQLRMSQTKILYPHFQSDNMFALEPTGFFSNNKSYFMPTGELDLLAYLNSRLAWFFFTSVTPSVRNGWREMGVHFVERLPMPRFPPSVGMRLAVEAEGCGQRARERTRVQSEVRHRLLDLSSRSERWSSRLQDWHMLDFATFRVEIKRVFGADIPPRERRDWEIYLAENAAEVRRLAAEIVASEREIDRIIYRLFELTPDEITLLEGSLT